MIYGSLFSGVGGFDLGFERAGMICKWQVEIDDFCNRVLARRYPHVERHCDASRFALGFLDRYWVDVLCGGFPCQDTSNAGKRVGIGGPQSGLWKQFRRIISVLRPRVVVVENAGSLNSRGLDVVLGDLAEIGFDAEWSSVSACSMGAPHTRDRMFIVAHSDPIQQGQRGWEQFAEICREEWNLCQWPSEPEPLRVVVGLPDQLDRNRVLGNAVMPQIAEMIARSISRVMTINRAA
jgi:DNA (cytosine-5)-methyltransferase 1